MSENAREERPRTLWYFVALLAAIVIIVFAVGRSPGDNASAASETSSQEVQQVVEPYGSGEEVAVADQPEAEDVSADVASEDEQVAADVESEDAASADAKVSSDTEATTSLEDPAEQPAESEPAPARQDGDIPGVYSMYILENFPYGQSMAARQSFFDEMISCEGDYYIELLAAEGDPRSPDAWENAAVKVVAKDSANPPLCTVPEGMVVTVHFAQPPFVQWSADRIFTPGMGKVYLMMGDGNAYYMHAATFRAVDLYPEGPGGIWKGETIQSINEDYTLFVDPWISDNFAAPDPDVVAAAADPSMAEETRQLSRQHGLSFVREGIVDKWTAGGTDLSFSTLDNYLYLVYFEDGTVEFVEGGEDYEGVSAVEVFGPDDFGLCDAYLDVPVNAETDLDVASCP